MRIIAKAKPIRIRIKSGGEEHSSLDSLRQNLCVQDLWPLVKDKRLSRWLRQLGEVELAHDIDALSESQLDFSTYFKVLVIFLKDDLVGHHVTELYTLYSFWHDCEKRKSKNYDSLRKYLLSKYEGAKFIFIVGMPGCGKSLCAKASAALFNSPLLKLDMGSMMGKYVGESEGNLRKAIKIAEAAAPCVLWIDEIEKAFSGVGGNNDIMTRMFGYFLSWMQEKQTSVYVIATANNADNLPPELKRKGRFDEIFCVNLPDKEERKDIFKIHLEKKKKSLDDASLNSICQITDGFNGADIESVVNEAVEECFLSGVRELSKSVLEDIARQTISISKSCKKQIDNMKKAFKENNFKDATTGDITT